MAIVFPQKLSGNMPPEEERTTNMREVMIYMRLDGPITIVVLKHMQWVKRKQMVMGSMI